MINSELKNICINPKSSINKLLDKIVEYEKNGVFVVNKNFPLKGIINDSCIGKKLLEKRFNNIKLSQDIMRSKFLLILDKESPRNAEFLINFSKGLMPNLKNKKTCKFLSYS